MAGAGTAKRPRQRAMGEPIFLGPRPSVSGRGTKKIGGTVDPCPGHAFRPGVRSTTGACRHAGSPRHLGRDQTTFPGRLRSAGGEHLGAGERPGHGFRRHGKRGGKVVERGFTIAHAAVGKMRLATTVATAVVCSRFGIGPEGGGCAPGLVAVGGSNACAWTGVMPPPAAAARRPPTRRPRSTSLRARAGGWRPFRRARRR